MKRRTFPAAFGALALALSVVTCAAVPVEAEARGFSGRSSSARGYSRPAPRPQVVHRTTVVQRNTTIVQQAAPASGGGGGFFSSFLGGAAGAGLSNMLMNGDDDKKESEAVAPQEVSAVPAATPLADR